VPDLDVPEMSEYSPPAARWWATWCATKILVTPARSTVRASLVEAAPAIAPAERLPLSSSGTYSGSPGWSGHPYDALVALAEANGVEVRYERGIGIGRRRPR
jgi:hypothetical protein